MCLMKSYKTHLLLNYQLLRRLALLESKSLSLQLPSKLETETELNEFSKKVKNQTSLQLLGRIYGEN